MPRPTQARSVTVRFGDDARHSRAAGASRPTGQDYEATEGRVLPSRLRPRHAQRARRHSRAAGDVQPRLCKGRPQVAGRLAGCGAGGCDARAARGEEEHVRHRPEEARARRQGHEGSAGSTGGSAQARARGLLASRVGQEERGAAREGGAGAARPGRGGDT